MNYNINNLNKSNFMKFNSNQIKMLTKNIIINYFSNIGIRLNMKERILFRV